MKELFKHNKLSERQQIESIVKKKKQVEFKYESSIKPYKGHKVFEINLNNLTIKEADYVKRKDIHWFEAIKFMNSGYKQDVLIRKGCVYISALNKESALKRFKTEKGSATMPKGKLELKIY
jgi:hypothetical protein